MCIIKDYNARFFCSGTSLEKKPEKIEEGEANLFYCLKTKLTSSEDSLVDIVKYSEGAMCLFVFVIWKLPFCSSVK